MTFAGLIGTLWRRKLLFALTTAACLATIIGLTLTLPKQYDATTTLFVGQRDTGGEAFAFDTNIGEQLSRTYSTLAAQPSVADEVRGQLPGQPGRGELLGRMTFAPVERTQLLQITARDRSAQGASVLANRYAQTFISQVAGSFERGGAPTRLTLAAPAVVPSSAATPNVPLYVGLGAFLALLLGAGAVLLREHLDDRLTIEADDLELLEHPVLGRVPEFSSRQGPSHAVVDAFRLLRTNIDFAAQPPPRVIAVTSSSPLEGKSTVAAQSAIAAAQDGERVVLLEADLRRPGLRHTALGRGVELPAVGLTNYLVGGVRLESILSEHPAHPGLAIVWPGPLPPNPSRLLGSEHMAELIAELREHFDRVFVDTSPISVGADASVIMARVDGAIFVVDSQRTSRSRARRGISQLETSRVRVLGIVVNRAGKPGRDSYGYYAAKPGDHPQLAEPDEPVFSRPSDER